MKLAFDQHWFSLQQHAGQMYVCSYAVNQMIGGAVIAELKDEVIEVATDPKTGKKIEAVEEQQIIIKKGKPTILHIFEYCSFCGVKLDTLPGPKRIDKIREQNKKK